MPTLNRAQILLVKFVWGACVTLYLVTVAHVLLTEAGFFGYAAQ